MKKTISLLMALVLCFGLCACGEKEPSELEKARAEAKAARDTLDSINKAADEAEERLEDVKKLMDDLFGN